MDIWRYSRRLPDDPDRHRYCPGHALCGARGLRLRERPAHHPRRAVRLADPVHARQWRQLLLRGGLPAHVPGALLRLLQGAARNSLDDRCFHPAGDDGDGDDGGDGGSPSDTDPVIVLLGDDPLAMNTDTEFEDQGATATDSEDGDISESIIVDTSGLDTTTPGTYFVKYSVTDSDGNKVEVSREVAVVEPSPEPTTDNGATTQSDTGGGSGVSGGGGGNGGIAGSFPNGVALVAPTIGGAGSSGSVLGASTVTGQILGVDTCVFRFNDFIMTGGLKVNDPEEVMKLQDFLNENLGLNIDVNGIYNQATIDAVKKFQFKHRSTVLDPWGISSPTGNVYLTTRRWLNVEYCRSLGIVLDLEMPALIGWSQNPNALRPRPDVVITTTSLDTFAKSSR